MTINNGQANESLIFSIHVLQMEAEDTLRNKQASATQQVPNLTSGRLLAANAIWNLLGQLLPLPVAIAAIPPLFRSLGIARFGVLSLAWTTIGYFSFFDLGIGRALTKTVAEKLGQRNEQEIVPLVWTSLAVMIVLGVFGGFIILVLSPWIVYRILKIPAELQLETLHSFYLMALCLPLITATSGLRGILEALQRFRAVNMIRIPMSAFSFIGPLIVLPFSHSLVYVISGLTLIRFGGCIAHLLACLRSVPALRDAPVIKTSLIRPVLVFGGWMTVSNVISPVLIYIDRFVLGATVSISVVAFYTAPMDMVVRLLVIPGAIAGVLFPAFALSLVQNPERVQLLLNRSLKYVFLVMFPVTLALVILAPEGLRMWLGRSFSDHSTSILRWLAAGALANSMAQAPFALVQSSGRPDLTAKLHLAELPLYLCAVWWLTATRGIEGTAMAWTGRLVLDMLLIGFVLERMFHHRLFLMKVASTTLSSFVFLYLGAQPVSLPVKMISLGLALSAFSLISWFLVLTPNERGLLLKRQAAYEEAGI